MGCPGGRGIVTTRPTPVFLSHRTLSGGRLPQCAAAAAAVGCGDLHGGADGLALVHQKPLSKAAFEVWRAMRVEGSALVPVRPSNPCSLGDPHPPQKGVEMVAV